MTQTALGKVAAAIYGEIAPTDTSFLWGKQLDPVGSPNLVQFFYHDGTNWEPLKGSHHFKDPVINQLGTPPVSPSNGDRYLVAASGTTGDFVAHENEIAVWNSTSSAWEFTLMTPGDFLYNTAELANVLFNGTIWLTQSKTTEEYFDIEGGTGAKLKAVGGGLELRDLADASYISLTVNELTITGPNGFWFDSGTTTLDDGDNVLIDVQDKTTGLRVLDKSGGVGYTIKAHATLAGGLKIGEDAGLSMFFDPNNVFGGGAGFFIDDQRVNGPGLQYKADYSGDYVARSLIDKGFADVTYWGTSGTTTLTGATTISGDTNTHALSILDLASLSIASSGTISIQSGVNPNFGKISVSSTQSFIHIAASALLKSINLDSSSVVGIKVQDTIASSGLYYTSDYSTDGITNHGDRWIPDKGYNDATYAPIGVETGWSLTGTATLNYPATGATNFTAVDGITNQLDLSGQDTAETYDFITQNILTTGRLSTGDANFLRFQENSADVFKVESNGASTFLDWSITGKNIRFYNDGSLANVIYQYDGVGKFVFSNTLFGGVSNGDPVLAIGTDAFTWNGDTDTSLYHKGADNVAIATGGIDAIEIDAVQTTIIQGDGFILPVGLDAARVATNGSIRLSSTSNNFEGYKTTGGWVDLEGGGIQPDTDNVLTDGSITSISMTGDATPSRWDWYMDAVSDTHTFRFHNYYARRPGATVPGIAGLGGTIGFYSESSTNDVYVAAAELFYRSLSLTGDHGQINLVGKSIGTDAQIALIGSSASGGHRIQMSGSTVVFVEHTATNTTKETDIIEMSLLSGTVAAGFGSSSPINLENASGSVVNASNLVTAWVDPTAASEDSEWIVKTMVAGSLTEGLRVKDGGAIMGTALGKNGFFGATGIVQPAHIADPTGGATVDSEARTAINSILAQMASLGLQASS